MRSCAADGCHGIQPDSPSVLKRQAGTLWGKSPLQPTLTVVRTQE